MKRFGWIFLGSVLAATMASAQQVNSPASSSVAQQTQTIDVGPPAHPATEDQIRELMSLTRVDKLAHDAMDSGVRAMQATSAPYYPASFWSDMRTEFQKVDVTAAYVQVYQRYVSQSDMQAVIDFYRSPAGHRLLEVQPLVMRDAQPILKKKGEEIGLAVYAKHKDEIEAAKKQFEAGRQKPAIDLGSTTNK